MVQSSRAKRGLPSFRGRVAGSEAVSAQLACVAKLHRSDGKDNCYERGFPFLDRDFLEFMFAIPRSQVLRPRQCRSLMRRALAGVVPDAILNRTRKAFSVRRPALGLQEVAPHVRNLFSNPFTPLEWVDPIEFLKSVDDLTVGKNNRIVPVQRTIALEMWLRCLVDRQIPNVRSEPSTRNQSVLAGAA